MKKVYLKLVAVVLILLLSLTVMATASYAWFVLSKNPAANGIQVTIGGGNTIRIAADITEVGEDGVTYHYPGEFDETLNFAYHDSYSYLSELGGLSPVSTADGLNWFVSTYINSRGELVSCSLDKYLEYANLSADETDKISQGSYIYLDFWVVSPGSDYKLRVSTNKEDGGSFVIDLLEPTQEEDGGYTLTGGISSTAASVRVGFMASPVQVTDNSMVYYQASKFFDTQYAQLRGVYQEPDYDYTMYGEPSYFTIYEPNGDAHPTGAAEEGSYVATYPIGWVDDSFAQVSVMDRLTVQLTNRWSDAENGDGTAIEQHFQAAILGVNLEGKEISDISYAFYSQYLQGLVAPYVDMGEFIENTSDLSDTVSAQEMAQLDTAGATEDVYIIELERNVPQRIRMYIWLEAMDVDWDDQNAASGFALNIELAGGTE